MLRVFGTSCGKMKIFMQENIVLCCMTSRLTLYRVIEIAQVWCCMKLLRKLVRNCVIPYLSIFCTQIGMSMHNNSIEKTIRKYLYYRYEIKLFFTYRGYYYSI